MTAIIISNNIITDDNIISNNNVTNHINITDITSKTAHRAGAPPAQWTSCQRQLGCCSAAAAGSNSTGIISTSNGIVSTNTNCNSTGYTIVNSSGTDITTNIFNTSGVRKMKKIKQNQGDVSSNFIT